jgi:SAM-dependent methyltransferase
MTMPAAELWADQLGGWGLPQRIIDQAPESPWFHDPGRFAVDDLLDRNTISASWAREVLPANGGAVLDVGCGGGRSSMTLVPPAAQLIGVDPSRKMLDEFERASEKADVSHSTVQGIWPDVSVVTPVADVVVCHHVLFNVGDVVPFLDALTDHARLAVVVEIPTAHPMSAWSPAWKHFWDLDRPTGPTASDLVAVLREMGHDPEMVTGPRSEMARAAIDPETLVPTSRRRLCLSSDRDDEIASWLGSNPIQSADTVASIRWPGSAVLEAD